MVANMRDKERTLVGLVSTLDWNTSKSLRVTATMCVNPAHGMLVSEQDLISSDLCQMYDQTDIMSGKAELGPTSISSWPCPITAPLANLGEALPTSVKHKQVFARIQLLILYTLLNHTHGRRPGCHTVHQSEERKSDGTIYTYLEEGTADELRFTMFFTTKNSPVRNVLSLDQHPGSRASGAFAIERFSPCACALDPILEAPGLCLFLIQN